METLEFIKAFANKEIGYTTSNLNYTIRKKLIREGIAKVVDFETPKKVVKESTEIAEVKTEAKTENKPKRRGRKPKGK